MLHSTTDTRRVHRRPARLGATLALLLCAPLLLAGCADDPTPPSTPATRQAAAESSAPTAATTPMKSDEELDLDSDAQWERACLLPLADVAAIASATIHANITQTANDGNGEAESCSYEDPASDAAFDIQINGYDSASTYGFLIDDRSSSWSADSPEDGYDNACGSAKLAGSKGIVCRTVNGAGVVSGWGEAIVFSPGKYFFSIGVLSVGQDESTGAALQQLGAKLAASDPKP